MKKSWAAFHLCLCWKGRANFSAPKIAQVRALKELMLSWFGADKLCAGDYLNSVSQGLAWSYCNQVTASHTAAQHIPNQRP
jgi:hypothetical protein